MRHPLGSVTLLVRRAETGDDAAFDELLMRYMPRLMQLARGFQLTRHSASASGSDYVNITCLKLWCGIVRSRLETIDNRDNLWQLLARMTKNEVVNHARHEGAVKRGGGNVINASGIPTGTMEAAALVRGMPNKAMPSTRTRNRPDVQTLTSAEAFSAQDCDEATPDHECMEVLESLPLDLQEIATLALFGERTEEIAASLGCADRTVQRKLRLIRQYLSE